MKPEAQNQAIFESLGWKFVPPVPGGSRFIVCKEDLPRWKRARKWAFIDEIPDYVNDLNAIAEAEKTIPDSPGSVWRMQLEWVCGTMGGMLRATAAQRAEAYLKALGLWREDA